MEEPRAVLTEPRDHRAFRTAALLRDKGTLEFVLAPLFDRDGDVIRRLNDRYAVTVSPLIDGESSEYGPYEEPDDRRAMGVVLGRLHAATDQVPADFPRREDFALPSRAELVEALHDLDRAWDSGPLRRGLESCSSSALMSLNCACTSTTS
jgi:spectinomycin phosphotransferase